MIGPGAPGAVTMQCLEVWGGNASVDNGVVMPGLDAWVVSRPFAGERAGGDIHYVSSCASGRITRVLVADVSGHGEAVAQVALTLRGLMRRYVNFIDQGRLVEGINREFAGLQKSGEFATAVVATYWAPTDSLVITNAGHPRPLWYRARAREWKVLSQQRSDEGLSNIPLGIAEPTRYDESSLRLGRDDLVILYTDSLIEARNAEGRQLGEAGLLDLARGLDPARPESMIPTLIRRIEEYAGSAPPDDLTVLVLRRNELKPRISLWQGIRTSLRVAADFGRALTRGQAPARPEMRSENLLGAFFKRFNGAGYGQGED